MNSPLNNLGKPGLLGKATDAKADNPNTTVGNQAPQSVTGIENRPADATTGVGGVDVKLTDSEKDARRVGLDGAYSDSERADLAFRVRENLKAEGAVRWSSHPIQRFTVGRFQFEKGLLVLTEAEDIADFQEVYDSLPVAERARLQKLDLEAAERLARAHLGIDGAVTRGIDSSTGDRAPNNQTGRGRLEDFNLDAK